MEGAAVTLGAVCGHAPGARADGWWIAEPHAGFPGARAGVNAGRAPGEVGDTVAVRGDVRDNLAFGRLNGPWVPERAVRKTYLTACKGNGQDEQGVL